MHLHSSQVSAFFGTSFLLCGCALGLATTQASTSPSMENGHYMFVAVQVHVEDYMYHFTDNVIKSMYCIVFLPTITHYVSQLNSD